MNQLRSRLDGTDATIVLVRGANPPPRPPETVMVSPGLVATVGIDGHHAPLIVSAEASSGRTIRRYDGRDVDAAADRAEALVGDRDPRAAWLCDRARIAAWWGDGVARLLERRLAAAAREVNARLVVWTSAEDGAVGDRYDVVVDP